MLIKGLPSKIWREVKAQHPRTIIAIISFEKREEERLGKENYQTVKVIDKPMTEKSNSSYILSCKIPTTQEESIVAKVKVLDLEFISL